MSENNGNGNHGVVLDFGQYPTAAIEERHTPQDDIDGAEILDAIESFIRGFHVHSKAQSAVIAPWVVHTYCFRTSAWTPYLMVTSAAPECGKSQLLEVLMFLVASPLKTEGASASSLFRYIDQHRGTTMLLDELDTTFQGNKETAEAIRQIINAGAHKHGTVLRTEGEGKHRFVKKFSVYGPKVLAGIGDIPPTVSSRSIPIVLNRKLDSETVSYLNYDDPEIPNKAEQLKTRIAQWVDSIRPSFIGTMPEFPPGLTSRQKDGARILLLIADAAGADWPARVRESLCELHKANESNVTIQIKLLEDIRAIFQACGDDKIASVDLLEKLKEVETSPWSDWSGGKGLTVGGISKLLRPYGIAPRGVRIDDRTPKGYVLESFRDAFRRYLRPTSQSFPIPAATPPRIYIPKDLTAISDRNISENVAGQKQGQVLSNHQMWRCGGTNGEGTEHCEAEPVQKPKEEMTLPSCRAFGSFYLVRNKDGTTTCGTCQVTS